MMYIPRPWHMVIPFNVMCVGLYVGHNLQSTYDVVIFVIVDFLFAVAIIVYMVGAGLMYQAYLTGVQVRQDARDAAIREHNPRVIPNLGVEAHQPFEAVTQPVKLNREQQVSNILLHQHRHGFKVNLTEKYWLKGKRFDGSRDEFVAMLDKWAARGIIGRVDPKRKNSPYEVKDWRQVELVARGEVLPPPLLDYLSQSAAL